MEAYYDQAIGVDFARRVEGLRQLIRKKTFDENSSTFGIAGNTFRAYIGYNLPPSEVFREWAQNKTRELFQEDELEFSTQSSFDLWHTELFKSIKEYWESKQERDLSFAHTYKLIDLYLKWLLSNSNCPEKLANSILNFGYCALDSKILSMLNKCLSGALPIRNPTMGDIANQNTYDFCQALIKGFAEKHGGTRILFDFYAWERGGVNKIAG
ncbi:MAG: hypothetical protein Q7T53_00735 [Deltaproteobacteria bacterium]|nr:hypothetical protein [Deltaproteobacteria bacterium]